MYTRIGSAHSEHTQTRGHRAEASRRLRTVGILLLLVLAILVASLATDAQQATKVYRIGLLRSGLPPTVPNPNLEAFRQGLHDLGYVEGQNLVIEYRYAEGGQERHRDLAAELVRLQVDVIVAWGALAIRAAQHATRTIPIVMGGTSDAVTQGFIASLTRPGGNITGLTDLSAELPGKRLEILKFQARLSASVDMTSDVKRWWPIFFTWSSSSSSRCTASSEETAPVNPTGDPADLRGLVPPDWPPSGAGRVRGPRRPAGLVTRSRVAPHRGGVAAEAPGKPS